MVSETGHGTDTAMLPEAASYRPLSAAAVVACLVGLASPSAFFTPALWPVAVLGLFIGLWAWFHIHRFDPPMTGRTGVLVGVALSAFCLCGAPAHWWVERTLLGHEAEQFAKIFFDYLLKNEPHKAHQLSRAAFDRSPLDDKLWEKYPPNSSAREDLEAFLERKEVRAIMILGKDPRTKIRLFDTERVWRENTETKVAQSYAVTYYDARGVRKTFFVTLILNRYPLHTAGLSDWYVSDISSFAAPRALEGLKKQWEEAQKRKESTKSPEPEGPETPAE